MKITRTTSHCTVETELTPEELRLAYEEQQREYDKQDIQNYIEDYLDEDEDKPFAQYLEQHIEEAAGNLRVILDQGETGFADAREEVISRFRILTGLSALEASRIERD